MRSFEGASPSPLWRRTMSTTIRSLATIAVVVVIGVVLSAAASPLIHADGQRGAQSSVLPTGGGKALLDPSDTVILLLDHQAGLFQTVKDIDVAELRRNTVMLAKL